MKTQSMRTAEAILNRREIYEQARRQKTGEILLYMFLSAIVFTCIYALITL